MNLFIKQGRLFEGNQEVKPEIGNPAHIKALRDEVKRLEDFDSNDGMVVSCDVDEVITYNLSTRFKCVCGFQVSYEIDDCDEDVDGRELNERVATCYKCKQKYTLKWDSRNDQLTALKGDSTN